MILIAYSSFLVCVCAPLAFLCSCLETYSSGKPVLVNLNLCWPLNMTCDLFCCFLCLCGWCTVAIPLRKAKKEQQRLWPLVCNHLGPLRNKLVADRPPTQIHSCERQTQPLCGSLLSAEKNTSSYSCPSPWASLSHLNIGHWIEFLAQDQFSHPLIPHHSLLSVCTFLSLLPLWNAGSWSFFLFFFIPATVNM